MKKFAILGLLLCAILFTGCDETRKVLATAGNVQLNGSYIITDLGTQTTNNNELTVIFSALDTSVRGNAGCNTYFGDYDVDVYTLNFGAIGSTKKACEPKVMATENKLFKALEETGSYTLENNVLTLLSKNDRSVLLKARKN